MKKLIIILCILLLASPVNAFGPAIMGALSAGGAAAYTVNCETASTCKDSSSAATHCDVLCEDFETSGANCGDDPGADENCRVVYDVTLYTTGTIDFTTAPTAGTPCSWGSNAVTMALANGDTVNAHAHLTISGTLTYTSWYAIITDGLEDANDKAHMMQMLNSGGDKIWSLGFLNVAGNVKASLYYVDNAVANQTSTGATTITAGWHRYVVEHDSNTDYLKVFIDGGASPEISIAAGAVVDRADERFAIGSAAVISISGDGSIAIQVDNIRIDDDTMPVACN